MSWPTTSAANSATQCGLVPNTAFLTQVVGEQTVPVDDDSAAEAVRCPEIGIDKTSNDADGKVDAGQTVTFTILAKVVEGPVTERGRHRHAAGRPDVRRRLAVLDPR